MLCKASLGQLAAGVAHEINNPLTVIQGNLDVIQSELGSAAQPFKTEFTLIQDRVHAIHVLIGKLLRFARPEEFADSDQSLDPAQTARDTIPLVQHLLQSNGIDVSLNFGPTPQIVINKTELQQVLVNLCVNAIQAMPEGGLLSLITRQAENTGTPTAEIILKDNGIGMSDDIAHRIFDPFFTTKGRDGTGLGLSITRDIVERAGGTITVASVLGKGSEFTLRFPASQI